MRARFLVLASLSLAAAACSAASDQSIAASSVTATIGFPVLQAAPALVIPDTAVPVGSISAITGGPDGTIVIADQTSMTFVLYDSTGKHIRSLGRKGSGPGEFERIGPLGWIGDTLITLDPRLRRATFIAIPSGDVRIATWPTTAFGWPFRMLTTSNAVIAVVGTSVNSPDGTTMQRVMHYVPITSAGFQPEFAALSGVYPVHDFPVCDDGAGYTYFDIGPFRELGPLEGMTSKGHLVIAAPESLLFTIRRSDVKDSVVAIMPRRVRAPVSDTTWSIEASEYLAIKAKRPAVTCKPPYVRPPTLPAGRMLQIDESDNIWTEVSEQGGTSMHVLGVDGIPIGVFRMPARDQTVQWSVRRNRLYTVAMSASGAQEVRVYTIAR